jgi:hypothetical protein
MHTEFFRGTLEKVDHLKYLHHRCRREDDIERDRLEVKWEGGDWFVLAYDWEEWPAVVKTVMNIRVP